MSEFIVFKADDTGEEHPIAEFHADTMDAAVSQLGAEPDGAYRIIELRAERILAKTIWGWIYEDRPA